MKVKVEKRYPTIEQYRAKLKIKKYIINILKFIVTTLYGTTVSVGVFCMTVFFLWIDPDTGENTFVQVWNASVQRNGVVSTLSLDIVLIMMSYLCGKALNELQK